MIIRDIKHIRKIAYYFADKREKLLACDVRKRTGATIVATGPLFNKRDWVTYCDVKAHGVVLSDDQYDYRGLAWNEDDTRFSVAVTDDMPQWDNFMSCVMLINNGEPLDIDPTPDVARPAGRLAYFGRKDGTTSIWACKEGENNMDPWELQAAILALGDVDWALMVDGGGSVQLSQAGDDYIYSTRPLPLYVCIWEDPSEPPVKPNQDNNITNSPLADICKISPNRSVPRNHAIDTVTIHCYVGQASVEQMANYFAVSTHKCSCNYAIGADGRIALIVPESDRSWCSSSRSNDNRAITIEVASGSTHPYEIKPAAYDSLLELLADICRRNRIPKLLWKGDKLLIGQVDKQNMTVHRWFANKACPGDWLYSRHNDIANEVNQMLNGSISEHPKHPDHHMLQLGTEVAFSGHIHYASAGAKTGPECEPGPARITSTAPGQPHPYHVVAIKDGGSTVYGWVDAETVSPRFREYQVRVMATCLNIRSGPGTTYQMTGHIRDGGVYTIIEESDGPGASRWGRLKSGAGWIALDFCGQVDKT